MEVKGPLGRYPQTRRTSGRRGVTPIKSKHKKTVPKTRGHKLERKRYVPLRKHTDAQHSEGRETSCPDQHSDHSERKGDQDCVNSGARQDAEECTQVEQLRDAQDSEESVHPGPVQTVLNMPEQTAVVQTSDKEEIEAEELPWVV